MKEGYCLRASSHCQVMLKYLPRPCLTEELMAYVREMLKDDHM